MKLSRFTNHFALQMKKEIILLNYSKDDGVEIILKEKVNFNEYHFLKFTQEVFILAENNKLLTFKLHEKIKKDSSSLEDLKSLLKQKLVPFKKIKIFEDKVVIKFIYHKLDEKFLFVLGQDD
jgi:hypothetical protein